MPTDAPATPGSTLVEAKRSLRSRVLAMRDALSESLRREASVRIAARIATLTSFGQADVVLLTLPFRSEWDMRILAEHALTRAKTLALPRVDPASRTLVLHQVGDPERDVLPGYQGIPEPLALLPVVEAQAIDWVLVPGLAFDAHGRRLGYGGGYYDRLLASLRASTPRVAGAFDLQVVDTVPAGPRDARVDVVVTPTRTLVARRREMSVDRERRR